jgi:tetratricopeptide (TPR) repeat protein
MAKEARQSPKFPWDCDVPDDDFWKSLDYKVGRAFLPCYSESEISNMSFDPSLPREEKLQYLRDTLNNTLGQKEKDAAPLPVREVDYQSWNQLKFGLSALDFFLGDLDAEERTMRELYENGPNGTKNMTALHNLSGLLEKRGRYAEAETAALEVLPWMQSQKMLGGDSPQALGCMRVLVKSTWKQGRYEEAQSWIEKCEDCIRRMGEGDFAKYQDAERRQFDEELEALKEWKLQQPKDSG